MSIACARLSDRRTSVKIKRAVSGKGSGAPHLSPSSRAFIIIIIIIIIASLSTVRLHCAWNKPRCRWPFFHRIRVNKRPLQKRITRLRVQCVDSASSIESKLEVP